jgi:hypothetical protein
MERIPYTLPIRNVFSLFSPKSPIALSGREAYNGLPPL